MHPLIKKGLGVLFTIEEESSTKETIKAPSVILNSATDVKYSKNVETEKPFQQNNFSDFNKSSFVNTTNIDTTKYKKYFMELMAKNNLPGNDYYELNVSLESLEKDITDERIRFIAAFTPLKINGLTLTQINDSANSYITALDEDSQNFNNAIEQSRKTDLSAQKQKIDQNTRRIEDLSNEIKKLTQENDTISAQITQDEQEIAYNKLGYETEYKNMRSKIQSDLAKANKYLQ